MVQKVPTVSELDPLSPDRPVERAGLTAANVDSGFKYRQSFLLVLVLAYTGKLLLLPAPAAAQYDLGSNAFSLERYL